MTDTLIVRVQSKSGKFQLRHLSLQSTLSDLQKTLEERIHLVPDAQRILLGYPPREITTYDPSSTLSSLSIRTGDTLTVEDDTVFSRKKRRLECKQGDTQRESSTQHMTYALSEEDTQLMTSSQRVGPRSPNTLTQNSTSQRPTGSEVASSFQPRMGGQCIGNDGSLFQRIVPADNSCLFRCISILLCQEQESCNELRKLAAGIILSHSGKYTAAVLGRENYDYVQWLQKNESWGGAIELKVFSEHFEIELDVVDVQTLRIDRFGEDKGYPWRAFLLYNGIHYDPLVRQDVGGHSQQGIFPISDEFVLSEARQIAWDAHQGRQFTDVTSFSLRCLVCSKCLQGKEDAMEHASLTGHSNFGEV